MSNLVVGKVGHIADSQNTAQKTSMKMHVKNIALALSILCVPAFGLVSTEVMAGEKVNSKESLRICKSALEKEVPEGMRYKFKRNSATSVDSGRYKHWINLLEINGKQKTAKKLLCETSRTGEVLVLDVRDGRWKI